MDGAWVKQVSDTFEYVDTSVTSLTTVDGWDEMGFMWFNLSVCDYTGASNFDKKKDYTYINALNTLSHIKIGETTIGGQWDKDANDPYINLLRKTLLRLRLPVSFLLRKLPSKRVVNFRRMLVGMRVQTLCTEQPKPLRSER